MKNTYVRTLCCTGALLTTGVLVTGCAVVPAPVTVSADTVYAPVAPPVTQLEVVPAVPYVGAVWIRGYWNWSGGRHIWVPGHYVRPNPGYRWEPHQWVQRPGGGWSLHGGIWVR